MKIEKNYKKLGIIFAFFVTALLVAGIISYHKDDIDLLKPEPEKTWHKIAEITMDTLGDYTGNPSGASGWVETFLLDYAQTPSTALDQNSTDWSAAASSTAWGYVDADTQDIDIPSEDGAYYVVQCRFNDTVKDGGNFIGKRCRVTLNVTGDETIDDVIQYGFNSSDTTGGAVVCRNISSEKYIWINFFWDDNSDGYKVTDDGSMDWKITIEAKY